MCNFRLHTKIAQTILLVPILYYSTSMKYTFAASVVRGRGKSKVKARQSSQFEVQFNDDILLENNLLFFSEID